MARYARSARRSITLSSLLITMVVAMVVAGCAGFDRGCQSCTAENFGSDWIIVQYQYNGTPINCWTLKSTSVANENGSDGIYWKTPSGHLIHISGWYNRVQVVNRDFETAAIVLGISLAWCGEGKYNAPTAAPTAASTPASTHSFLTVPMPMTPACEPPAQIRCEGNDTLRRCRCIPSARGSSHG